MSDEQQQQQQQQQEQQPEEHSAEKDPKALRVRKSYCTRCKQITEILGDRSHCEPCRQARKEENAIKRAEEEKAEHESVERRTKRCTNCGKEFVAPNGWVKRCPDCIELQKREEAMKARPLTPEEQKQKKNSRSKASQTNNHPDNITEPKKAEIREILRDERGIKNDHVLDLCMELAKEAAKAHKIPANRHLFRQGLRATLAKTSIPEIDPNEVVDGEILYKVDLYALYDYGFWRQPHVSFEQWLKDRLRLKSSAFEMSQLLGKLDFGETHREWESFLPRWNPIGLKPDYTQREGLAWLNAQRSDLEGDKKRYLLVASRNSMKSTFIRIHALCLTLCYFDARILITSETNKLSKKGMKEFRGYVELQRNNPSMFQQYFREICVEPGDGSSLVYDNPLAHLGLPQNSLEQTSFESAVTGSRFDYGIADDPISRDNGTANEEQKEAALSKFGSVSKLKEPAGFMVNVQTPWTSGDLGETMCKKNEEDPEHPLAIRIVPVMDILPHAANKPLLQLVETDVKLNFLPKLDWRFVRDEMRSPEGIDFFKSQYLCIWPDEEDSGLRLTFDMDVLESRKLPLSAFQHSKGWHSAKTVMSCDTATSTAPYADFSVIAVAKIMEFRDKLCTVIVDVRIDRWKRSEICKNFCELAEKWHPTQAVFERDRGWEDLNTDLRRTAFQRSTVLPHLFFKPVSNTTANAKARRIKATEGPLSAGRLWFADSGWDTDIVFNQFVKLTGIWHRSTPSRKDDAPDCIGLLVETFSPRDIQKIAPEEREERRVQEEQEWEAQKRAANHARMFGGVNMPKPVDPQLDAPPQPQPRPHFPRAGSFATLPDAFKRGKR